MKDALSGKLILKIGQFITVFPAKISTNKTTTAYNFLHAFSYKKNWSICYSPFPQTMNFGMNYVVLTSHKKDANCDTSHGLQLYRLNPFSALTA